MTDPHLAEWVGIVAIANIGLGVVGLLGGGEPATYVLCLVGGVVGLGFVQALLRGYDPYTLERNG